MEHQHMYFHVGARGLQLWIINKFMHACKVVVHNLSQWLKQVGMMLLLAANEGHSLWVIDHWSVCKPAIFYW